VAVQEFGDTGTPQVWRGGITFSREAANHLMEARGSEVEEMHEGGCPCGAMDYRMEEEPTAMWRLLLHLCKAPGSAF
jgi:hypothetical protein